MPSLKTRTAPALYNALTILEMLAKSRSGLSLVELMEGSKLAKSSVHYLLVTLERCGYVLHNERNGRYNVGFKLLGMANSALHNLAVRQRTAAYLSGLRLRTGLTVHLAIFEQQEVVVIGKLDCAARPALASWIGKRMDVHCTALGKAILAFLPEEEFALVIQKYGLARRNENTLCTARRLRKDLEQVVQMKYALDNEEDELGIRCLGVPIFGPGGRPLAAISVSGSINEITMESVAGLVDELRQTANSIRGDVIDTMSVLLADGSMGSELSVEAPA